ncbi:hypothetical protein EJ08DRAFT_592157 [Tothia fuscella]|uniref:Methyltransferase domain-containing protein n=1 Tax=Tothia fuscella TaxID=1048955 RepID=A0A9P4TWY8_9PEZI|nr:hypothetical protein EJ08DRAFT_592157 [Tothia fuscella]
MAITRTEENVSAIEGNVTGRDLSFYNVNARQTLDDAARKLIINYAGVAPEKVDEHVEAVREKAFAIFPYPCIGMFRFLDLSLLQTEVYPEVVRRVEEGEKLLDLGCCFGQEIRQLVSDGVPSENLYGADLREDFMAMGYDLFDDRKTLRTKFIAADVFDDNSDLNQLYGEISMVYTGSFFHLFHYDEQVAVAKRIIQILKPETGVTIIGRQMGNEKSGDYEAAGYVGEKQRFRHNADSWEELWNKVGDETGTKWKTEAVLEDPGVGMGEVEKKLTERRKEGGARRLKFVVRRL